MKCGRFFCPTLYIRFRVRSSTNRTKMIRNVRRTYCKGGSCVCAAVLQPLQPDLQKKLFINFHIQFDCFCLFFTEYSGFKNPNPQVSVLPPTSLTKISKIGHVNVTYRKVIKSKVSYSFGDKMCFCAAFMAAHTQKGHNFVSA